jgi:hypothetical protein
MGIINALIFAALLATVVVLAVGLRSMALKNSCGNVLPCKLWSLFYCWSLISSTRRRHRYQGSCVPS